MDNHLSFGCRNWQVPLRFYSLLWIQCSHLFLHRSTKRYCFWLLSYLVDNLRKSNRRLEANSKLYQGINANSRSMRWAGHTACMGGMRNAYILIWKSELNRQLGWPTNKWEDITILEAKGKGFEDDNWIHLAHDRDQRSALLHNHHHHRLDSPTWALAFLISFCQMKYPDIASSDFVTRVFSRVGLSVPRPTPSYPGGPLLHTVRHFIRVP
jgi:hypothetical protein